MKKKVSHVIEFYDEEMVYAIIRTEENPKEIEKLFEEYKQIDKCNYSMDGFFDFLKKKGIKFEVFPEPDVYIYF